MKKPDAFHWPSGQIAAVSLTYDDAMPEHREHVAPLLTAHGLHGTFYVDIRERFIQHHDAWRAVAAAGHELGNHTLFHPCRSEEPRVHNWLDRAYNLCDYTPRRWRDEVRVANFVLQLIDGRTERSFGNTCCDEWIGRGENRTSLEPLIAEQFVAARGSANRIVTPAVLNFSSLGYFPGDDETFASIRARIDQAVELGGWVVFMIHGVGPANHRLYIREDEHRQLVEWLGRERGRIWTAPVVEVARHLRSQ